MDLAYKIDTYQPSSHTIELVSHMEILLIAGIVCAGKDTIVKQLLQNDMFSDIVSHTTRSPRANHGILEKDGIDYHFISLQDAEQMVDQRAFVEVKYVHGNVYGTSIKELETIHQSGKVAVNDIDVHGVSEYLALKPNTKAIFLLPPSVDTWLRRMEKRYGVLDMNSEELKTRFATAITEIEHIRHDPRFIMVINDDVVTTVERIMKVLNHEREETSEFAVTITDHLLEYLRLHI